MRIFATGLMLMVLPLLVAGKQVEIRVGVPAPWEAAISAAVSQEVNDGLQEASEDFRRVREDIKETIGDSKALAATHLPATIVKGSADDAFVPDVYPSQRAAIRFAAEEWVKQVVLGSEKTPTSIHIVTEGRTPGDAVQELRNAVHSLLPAARSEVHVVDGDAKLTPQASPGAAWVEFELAGYSGGAAVLKGSTPALPAIEVGFVSKPWVEDFAEYTNHHPGERWIMVQSQRTCASEMDAKEDATRQAAQSVIRVLRPRVADTPQFIMGIDEAWLAARVQGELERGGLVKDRFVQRYERPYGTLWRESVLVDVSDSSMDYLAAGVLNDLRARHATVRNTAVSVLGLLVVIYVLYLLVNAVTKGYFVWRLRTAAVVLVAVGILMVMWFVAVPSQRWDRRVGSHEPTHDVAPPSVHEYRIEQ